MTRITGRNWARNPTTEEGRLSGRLTGKTGEALALGGGGGQG